MALRTVLVAVPVPVDRLFTYSVPDEIDAVQFGVRVIVPFGRRTLTGVVVDADPGPTEIRDLKSISRVIDDAPLFDPEYLELARWVSTTYLSPLGEALSAMLPSARRGKELLASTGDEPETESGAIVLSREQREAIDRIVAAESSGGEAWYYLYGITGSGKTEVFLHAAERTIAVGAGALYLVPEIALTHQLFEHLSRRFGGRVAMLHSGLTPAQRLGEWRRIRRGDASLVVGARSAVFAPLPKLGLIVIDEEHEGSYKAGNAPRYHARQVALWRARRTGAACVMGSATPSVEAWHLMSEGRLRRLDLTTRLSGGALPKVRIENVRGSASLISPRLKTALQTTHEADAQSILFLNRRGYAGVFQCRSCGYRTECPRCSVPMTYHKHRGWMVCHYCGSRTSPIAVCPACGSLDIGYTGFGTERIEEDLARELPQLRIARLDTDVTRQRGSLGAVLNRFAAGEIDVLLGTQIVARGFNFPRVRTVGIIMAETGLSLPDFRAAERTFALIVQVAGRAGRFRTDGEVIVQTLRPEHTAIQRAARMEIEEFYVEELAVRKELQFPPFSRLLRIVVRSTRRYYAEGAANRIATSIRRWTASGDRVAAMTEVLGPAPAPLERINRNWRYQILLRGPHAGALVRVVESIRGDISRQRGSYVELDVDPVELL